MTRIFSAFHATSSIALFTEVNGRVSQVAEALGNRALSGKGPAPDLFTVTVNGTVVPVLEVVMYGNVYLRLGQTIPANAAVTVAYRDPEGDQAGPSSRR